MTTLWPITHANQAIGYMGLREAPGKSHGKRGNRLHGLENGACFMYEGEDGGGEMSQMAKGVVEPLPAAALDLPVYRGNRQDSGTLRKQ